jgi:polysaccharide biosynthesis transport protein
VDLADHFRVIARNLPRVLLVSVVAAAIVYFLSARRDDVYRAETFLNVQAGRAVTSGSPTQDDTVFLAETYAQLATTQPVARRAAKESGLDISADDAQSRISAFASSDLGFVTIEATGSQPDAASTLANAAADGLIAELNSQQESAIEQELAPVNAEIETTAKQLSTLSSSDPERSALQARYEALLQAASERRTQPRNRVEVLSKATAPDAPISPKPLRDALLGFLGIFVVTAELSVVLRVLSDRFAVTEDVEDIARFTGLPVLATIARGSDSSVVEAFRTLRTSIMMIPGEDRPHTVAVVSSVPGEGKSFTAIHLAQSAARLDAHVVIVDADLRRPAVHERLGIPREPGLSDVLAGLELNEALRTVEQGGIRYEVRASGAPLSEGPLRFYALPSGAMIPDPAGALSGRAFPRLLDALDHPDHLVIVDTPPVNVFADALTVAASCDATVLVIDVRASRRRQVRRAIDAFTRVGANLVGVVVNQVEETRHDYPTEQPGPNSPRPVTR